MIGKARVLSGMVAAAVMAFLAPSARANDLETLGDVLQYASPAIALHESYRLNGITGLRSCGGAVAGNLIATHAIKRAVDARRPNGGGQGFPSGHTSAASVGFGCSLGQTGWSATSFALGSAALITGYSRVDSDNHSWDQVVVGFALGTAIGYFSTVHLRDNMRMGYGVTQDGSHAVFLQIDF